MRTWANRGIVAAVLTGGFLVAGGGLAVADQPAVAPPTGHLQGSLGPGGGIEGEGTLPIGSLQGNLTFGEPMILSGELNGELLGKHLRLGGDG